MTRRDETLRAASEAATALAESHTGARTSFDVVAAIMERDIPLLFRPLDRLWGAFITTNDDERGIIVSTRLALPVQRFTVAHELGHLMLGHRMSLDETIGFAGRNAPTSRPTQEAAADTFASELLAPKYLLLLASARRHGWTKDELRRPENIYQLSLRLGITYEAACWALVTCDILTRPEAARLQAAPVEDLKRALAPAALIANSRADVSALTAPTPGPSSKPIPTICSRPTFRTTPLQATSGTSSTRPPEPKSSAREHRIAHTPTVRDRRACCTSGLQPPACTISSSSTSGRGAGLPSPASRSTSMATEENVRVGRAA